MHDQLLLFTEAYQNEKDRFFVKSKDEQLVTELLSDTSRRKSKFYSGIVSIVKQVFLPEGYPDSVHPDYTSYQIWDTIQAFASTIMGTLTTHSIMRGVGVGEASAKPLSAAITWILKDGIGMIGRILFAWWNGTDLDGQCKKWRLFADILNDLAMGLELLLLPYFPQYSMGILCVSTGFKAIVGVAGGATRAAITSHQALENNLADVSAKDGSQETCVNLVASFFGILVLAIFQTSEYIMELYLCLVIIHLYANYSAVKALCFNSLNEDRLALIVKSYMSNEVIPPPEQINKQESVLLLARPTIKTCGFNIKMGVSLSNVIRKNIISTNVTELLLKVFRDRKYFIFIDVKSKTIFLCFKKGAESSDHLEAYLHACLCGLFISMSLKLPLDLFLKPEVNDPSYPLMRLYALNQNYTGISNRIQSSNDVETIYATDLLITNEYKQFRSSLEQNGWITESNLLPDGAWRFS